MPDSELFISQGGSISEHLGLTSFFLQNYHKLREKHGYYKLQFEAGRLLASEACPTHGFVTGNMQESQLAPLEEGANIAAEIESLCVAVTEWLDKRHRPEILNSIALLGQPYIEPEDMNPATRPYANVPEDGFSLSLVIGDSVRIAGFNCYHRLRQAPACPENMTYQPVRKRDKKTGKVLSWESYGKELFELGRKPEDFEEIPWGPQVERLARVHESDNLLALAWAEIWYAFDFHIRVRVCPYCWTVFKVPVNNRLKHTCGSKECLKQYLIDSHGGIEGYRAWERERKLEYAIRKKQGKEIGRGHPHKDGSPAHSRKDSARALKRPPVKR